MNTIKDISTTLTEILSLKDPIQIRLEMTKLGWSSNDQLTDMGWKDGEYGYSIWFERWDWYGAKVYSKICFHAHESDLNKILETIKKAVSICFKSWISCPDFVPIQLVNDQIRENTIATRYWDGRKKSSI
ncbi:MAG: hypothetical protein WC026_13240 [Hyphomicrobium sp.]|uniref:hypothetical protein n=1 Tax=Hyphomicrobium sp. TaxID=82 RepID=UPI003561C3B4